MVVVRYLDNVYWLYMDQVMKMLRAVINGQSSMKQELLGEIGKVRKDVADHRKETELCFKQVNKRIDKLGSDLAYLEDDAPTREEHDQLDKRVTKLEHQFASA